MYIVPSPFCLDVHFQLKTLKVRLDRFLQVKIMVLYEKQGYRSTRTEGFFKIKVASFYVLIHKVLRLTHNMCRLTHDHLRLTPPELLAKPRSLSAIGRHTRSLGRHIEAKILLWVDTQGHWVYTLMK